MARKMTTVLLSGSTRGKPIKVAATATAGTVMHATGVSASVIDQVWLKAHNSSGTARNLTIEFGGVTDPDDLIIKTVSIPANTLGIWVVEGQPLVGTGSVASTVAAFASVADVITISGFVVRIT